MTDPIATGLLERAFADDCTAAERAALEQWIAADPSRAPLVALLREAWANAGHVSGVAPLLDKADIRTAWQHVASRAMGQPASTPGAGHTAGVRPHRWPRGVGEERQPWRQRPMRSLIAGVLVTGLAFVVVTRWWALSPRHWHEYVTAPGQRETVTLIDGTQLTLAPASRLRVPVDYGRTARAVSLEGEGYFVVVHDVARPFEVRAGNAVARDVGTAFDVRAYGDEPTVRVAVTNGRVALGGLGATQGGVDLDAGETADVGRSGVLGAVTRADVAMLTAWTSGTLAFHDTPLRDVALALSRWYGANVRIADAAIADRPLLTATYSGLSLAETIRLISAATSTRAAWSGDGAVTLSAWRKSGR